MRRNPDAKWRLTESSLLNYQKDQLAIVENAMPHLMPGGRLYYVTCSTEPEENEQVAEKLLSRNCGILDLVQCPDFTDGYYRCLPHKDGCDGFFMAVFLRV